MIKLEVEQPYIFGSVRDHGWVALAPCRWLDDRKVLQRVERLSSGRVVKLQIGGDEPETTSLRVEVDTDGDLTEEEQVEIRQNVRRMLRLDEDFSEFYQLAAQHPKLWNRVGKGRGRLLRSPTLFEDVVKTICTTNTTWRQTKAMVERLVNLLGASFPLQPELKAFPTPAQIAGAGDEVLKEEIRLGYRSGYVLQLAQEIVSGERDLEAFKAAELSAEELKREFRNIKGVGPYATHTLLMLMGHYHEVAVDTELRSFVVKKYFNGQPVTDQELAAIYDPWGDWKYLAYWFDEGE